MDNGYMQEIRARILAAEDGAVFVAPDFADIADTATIRQGLKRLYHIVSSKGKVREPFAPVPGFVVQFTAVSFPMTMKRSPLPLQVERVSTLSLVVTAVSV